MEKNCLQDKGREGKKALTRAENKVLSLSTVFERHVKCLRNSVFRRFVKSDISQKPI
jgi:hypothetical protein